MQCIVCSMHYAVFSMQGAVCGVQKAFCSMRCVLCRVQYAVCSIQYEVYNIQCSVCIVQYGVCSMQCIMGNLQYVVFTFTIQCAVASAQYAVCSMHSAVHLAHIHEVLLLYLFLACQSYTSTLQLLAMDELLAAGAPAGRLRTAKLFSLYYCATYTLCSIGST